MMLPPVSSYLVEEPYGHHDLPAACSLRPCVEEHDADDDDGRPSWKDEQTQEGAAEQQRLAAVAAGAGAGAVPEAAVRP